ncbi:MAG: OadG family protein [Bacteroidaceae bacterium]|jgi:Na+-transporting methylmalonyl-CoA/oxaloacetate decarboxylase gamma subunit|nr:OadG family protein [Bacteroidaceae bacterium]
MTLLTVTSSAWGTAGICVGVVFAILLVLVLVLGVFSLVAKRANKQQTGLKTFALAPGKHADAADGDDLVVVATALYLYLNSVHDEESGVITIKNTQPSNWHAVLNPRL